MAQDHTPLTRGDRVRDQLGNLGTVLRVGEAHVIVMADDDRGLVALDPDLLELVPRTADPATFEPGMRVSSPVGRVGTVHGLADGLVIVEPDAADASEREPQAEAWDPWLLTVQPVADFAELVDLATDRRISSDSLGLALMHFSITEGGVMVGADAERPAAARMAVGFGYLAGMMACHMHRRPYSWQGYEPVRGKVDREGWEEPAPVIPFNGGEG